MVEFKLVGYEDKIKLTITLPLTHHINTMFTLFFHNNFGNHSIKFWILDQTYFSGVLGAYESYKGRYSETKEQLW